MSTLSKYIFDPIKAAFANAVTVGGGASQPAATQAVQNLAQAQALIEASIIPLINIGVNAVLGLIPQGAQFAALADQIIDGVIAGLLAKRSTPVTPTPLSSASQS